MQILLAVVLVGAALYFVLLRPKAVEPEPIAATPVTAPVATTPAGTTPAGEGQFATAISTAKKGAAAADAKTAKTEGQTGETDPTTPAAGTPAATTPAATASATPTATTPAATAKVVPAAVVVPAAQLRANRVITSIQRNLLKGNAVVFLIWSKDGSEDRLVHKRVSKQINTRRGHVKTYIVNVSDVGRYDGLLNGLNVAQTPSTIIIAPNNEAKILGGLVSTMRIDRLTSAAVLIKPTPAK